MADSEPNNNVDTTQYVDPNTDDLDAFNRLMTGKAKVSTEETPTKEPVKTEPKAEKEKPEDDTSESDSDDTEDQDASNSKPDGEEEKKPEKKVNRYQERINELTAKAREAERREAEVNRKLEELAAAEKKTANTPTPNRQQEVDDSPQPNSTNEDGSDKYPLGEFDPAYISDLTRYTIQKEQAVATQRFEQERVQKEHQAARDQLQEQWATKLTTVTETHEDFLDKTMELESTFEGLDPQYSDYLVQTIKSLDHGPEVLYHFANNLAEAQKFVKLGPLAATLALGEINAKFKANSSAEPTKPKVSNAPPPPQVNKGSKTRTAVNGDTDDLDAFSRAFFAKGK